MRIEMPDAEVNANSTTISIHEGLL
jgi:hypothetical protein